MLKHSIVGHPGHCMREIVVSVAIPGEKKRSLDRGGRYFISDPVKICVYAQPWVDWKGPQRSWKNDHELAREISTQPILQVPMTFQCLYSLFRDGRMSARRPCKLVYPAQPYLYLLMVSFNLPVSEKTHSVALIANTEQAC